MYFCYVVWVWSIYFVSFQHKLKVTVCVKHLYYTPPFTQGPNTPNRLRKLHQRPYIAKTTTNFHHASILFAQKQRCSINVHSFIHTSWRNNTKLGIHFIHTKTKKQSSVLQIILQTHKLNKIHQQSISLTWI